MIRPLCIVGIHRAVWVPTITGIDKSWAAPVRKCRDCGRYLGRSHRE